MKGLLDVEGLRSAVGKGLIDMVILAFPDMYGRMMGKRLDASYFLSDVERGTHVCDYLLTTDMEMYPVPGYNFPTGTEATGIFTWRRIWEPCTS